VVGPGQGTSIMKKLLGGIAISAFLAAPAIAADLPARMPVKAPPPVVAVYNWGGFYIGGQAGWGTSRHRWNGLDDGGVVTILDVNYPGSFTFNDNGFVGGGHAGVQGQWNNFVLGVEVAGTFTDLKATTSGIAAVVGTDDVLESRVRWLLTVVGKAGVVVGPGGRHLLYVKGGYAGGDVRASITDTVGAITGTWSNKQWHHGWTVGGGWDYALTDNWILGIEGNFVRLTGDSHSALDSTGAGPIFTNVRVDIATVMGRLSYKFGGPVVARY
jgi:outer membrane immunogenic protein